MCCFYCVLSLATSQQECHKEMMQENDVRNISQIICLKRCRTEQERIIFYMRKKRKCYCVFLQKVKKTVLKNN